MTIAIVTFYLKSIHNRAYMEIALSTNFKKGNFQIYWAGENQPFSEKQSLEIGLVSGKKRHYSFYFTDLTKVRRIRIDPMKKPGKVRIHHLVLTQEEIEPITLVRGRLKRLVPIRDVASVSHSDEGMLVESSGSDPSLLWEIKPKIVASGRLNELIRLIAVVSVCWIISLYVTGRGDLLVNVRNLLWWVVLGLVVTMAITSVYNKHPDEYVHANAARYYENHWLPPEICQPGTEKSYSVYGISRLNSKEIVYWLMGKTTALFSIFPIYDYLRLRIFNVLLLILMVLMWYRYRNSDLLFAPFFITPQAWYVFSYSNSDAFACLAAFFICQQVLLKDTFLKKWWSVDENEPGILLFSMICGMMLGLIYFTKPNYYIIYVFLAGYLLIEFLFEYRSISMPWRKLTGAALGGAFLMMLFYGPHILVNGLDRKQKIEDCREVMAKTPYKPSTPLNKKARGLYLKQKGVPLSYILEEKKWSERMFRSSVGVYGYTAYSGPDKYYQTMKILIISFGVVIAALILFLADNKRRLLLVWTISCMLLLVGIVLWRCWVADLQAQGRYLLPILPMMGALMYEARKAIDKPIVNLLFLSLFIGACYSFIFIGLKQIPKI